MTDADDTPGGGPADGDVERPNADAGRADALEETLDLAGGGSEDGDLPATGTASTFPVGDVREGIGGRQPGTTSRSSSPGDRPANRRPGRPVLEPVRPPVTAGRVTRRASGAHWKPVVPAGKKAEFRDRPDQNNVDHRTLFPGLDGIATWLAEYYEPNRGGGSGYPAETSRPAPVE